jgi:hypothetical protein
MVEFGILQGMSISEIWGCEPGSDQIIFATAEGRRFRLCHHQECCEHVTVEDVCGDPSDILKWPIYCAEERSSAGPEGHDSATWTFYHLSGVGGSLDIRWLGTSSGYYSEKVEFEEIDPNP